MLKMATCLLLVLLPLIFGQEEESFGCCPLKEVQGNAKLELDRYYPLNDGDALCVC